MNGFGQHQHTHHSGSWSLRLVPPFTWTAGGSPGSPASLCPCPSTVMAVRGVTPGLGLLRRLVAIQDTGVLQAIRIAVAWAFEMAPNKSSTDPQTVPFLQ